MVSSLELSESLDVVLASSPIPMGLNEQRAEFESVALQHLDALYGFALVLTGRSSDAEDLVQDTYIRALQFFHRYEQGTNCKAWLFTMMKRIFLNQVPKRAREVLCPDQDGPEGAESAGSLDYYAGLVDCTHDRKDEVFRQDVVKALELLPDSFRVVVILRDVEGFSYGEIAQMLDCPMGTVMSRLARGRDVLRQLLCAYANQDSRKLTHVKRIATDA